MRDMIQQQPSNMSAAVHVDKTAAADAGALDIKKYIYIIAKRAWILLICFAIAISIVFVKVMRQKPEYQASARIQLTRSSMLPSNLQQRDEQMILGDYVTTQREIILTGDTRRRAREKLEITAQEFAQNYISLDVHRQRDTAILNISVRGWSPAFCAQYANALAEAYLETKAEERSDVSQASVHSLSRETTRLLTELEKKENSLLRFVRENSVVGIHERGNVAAELLANLSKQAAEYKTQRMLLEAQQPLLSQASDEVVLATLGFMGVSSDPGSRTLAADAPESLIEYGIVQPRDWEALKRENSLLEAKLLEDRKRYKEEHPEIKETILKLRKNEEALAVELQFALRQFYSQLDALSIKEKAALSVEQAWEEQALEIDRKQKEYDALLREQKRLQGLYDLMFNRLKEIDISLELQTESVRILERAAEPSNPLEPRKLQTLFMGGLMGLAVGLFLIFALEYMDDSIRYPEDVSRTLGVPFLGLIPSAHWAEDDEPSHVLSHIDPESGFVEAYRNIRSALTLDPSIHPFKTLTVTSSVPQEGKTTTSVNLAVCFAQAGKKVLLVDADLRRGGVHHYFGLRAGRGLTDYLNDTAGLGDIIQASGIDSLDVIATGPFPANPAEIVLRPAMKQFLDEVSALYDVVVVDTPPVMAVSESPVLTSLTDGTVMVVWAGHTSKKLVQLSLRQLRIRGANIIGGILNNLDFNRVGYYYYSNYYSYYSYEYRYKADGKTKSKDASS